MRARPAALIVRRLGSKGDEVGSLDAAFAAAGGRPGPRLTTDATEEFSDKSCLAC